MTHASTPFTFALPPQLPTENTQPSWVNRAGRVDRSACFEVAASELWPRLRSSEWTSTRTFSGRIASARIVIQACDLFHLHRRRLSHTLAGDHRTSKSNAMKFACDLPAARPHANPNRGSSRTKRLGLWGLGSIGFEQSEWSQTLQLQRWHRGKPSRHPSPLGPPSYQHFIVCPGCSSTVRKLFMVLAHLQEIADAETAEAWIRLVDAHPLMQRAALNNPIVSFRYSLLIRRYSPLFRGRRLVCRKCLGIRYGEVKKTRPRKPNPQSLSSP